MSRKATKVRWTERMNSDILECKKKAKEMVSSNNPPYYTNGRKKGYIEVMKDPWEVKGYGYLGLMSQNLRDQASRLEKMLLDHTRNNGNSSVADRNGGEPESSEGAFFEENSQFAQQNDASRQAENANIANPVNSDLHMSAIDVDVVRQASNEAIQTTSPQRIQDTTQRVQSIIQPNLPITRCFPLKSRTKHGAISVTRVSVIVVEGMA